MKKFLLWLILIIIVGSVIFYIGWTQYRLDQDMYGVIYTKTSGYFEEPIESGHFSWSGWRLIPGNLTITQIPSSSRSISIRAKKTLPAADSYKMMVIGDPVFSYDADITISYSLEKGSVVALVSSYGVNELNSTTWFLAKDEMVRSIALEIITDYFIHKDVSASKDMISEDIKGYLSTQIKTYFTELNINDISMTFNSLPDFEIYSQAKKSYEEMVELKNETLADAILQSPEMITENMLYIDKLQNYGQLLSQYPILLEYLRIEQAQ